MARKPPMTEAEVRAFLTGDPPHTGKLATVRADGSPHVAPIWYTVDDRPGQGSMSMSILFTTGATTSKGRALQRDPRVALCVDDERPPFSFVIVHGTVTLSDDVEELRRWATIIGGRYMGSERAEEYGARNAVSGELLARITPTKVISERDVAG
jgi:PPOX class probable F420-dependent enzyme